MQSYNNYIGGEWVEGESVVENRNPSDINDLIGLYSQASSAQLEQALVCATEAQQKWVHVGLEARQQVLMAIGNELMQRSAELGELLSREEGKPLAEGKGEVYRAGQFFTYYAAEVLRQIGDTAQSVRPNIDVEVHREPIGVVAIISPWNFPTATAVWKIAPALAFGNAVVWKPANYVPASAVAVAEIISRQSIPSGLFNLVMGSGGKIGQHLVENPLVKAISFTGSVEVGKRIALSCIGNLTKVQMEMGSKNALVIMDDADMDIAVSASVSGAFGGSGQKCTASSRLIVSDKVYDEFVEKVKAATEALVVDHALKEGTQVGPVVSETQLQQNLNYVDLAKQEGGTVLCGGERLQRDTEGYYMSPALVVDTQNHWRINREEMFAPIACVVKVSSYEEALATVNDTQFGLTSGIITQSLARSSHFKHHARTGCVMVNLPTAGTDYHVPFGGRGNSSYGPREQGQYAQEFYTQVKTTYLFSGLPQ